MWARGRWLREALGTGQPRSGLGAGRVLGAGQLSTCTSSSVATSERRILATLSEMRTMASSWRTVMGTARGARPLRSASASSSTSPWRTAT